MTVQDKTVLVTGGTSGIGEATARAYATAHRTRRAARAADRRFATDGARARFVRADLERLEDIERLAKEIEHIDVLINNAGVFPLRTRWTARCSTRRSRST
jgi:NAD(P)-dependent dehydrogenase (short-subunit alcohol dehydrogenase family)